MKFLIARYRNALRKEALPGEVIKWSRNLKRRLAQGRSEPFDSSQLRPFAYRPFCRRILYDSRLFVDERGSADAMFPVGGTNVCICFSDKGSRTDYVVLAVDGIADLHFGSAVDAYQQVPRLVFEGTGGPRENVTDWALTELRRKYRTRPNRKAREVTKDAIFAYVYAVLHDPVYREKYALNLKREFPRLPFYADFWQWADWGKALMDLHIGYETVEPWPLRRHDKPDEGAREADMAPKAMLKADKEGGRVRLDTETTLSGIPSEAWAYQLGQRSALEWILDQYKERKPKDPTIRARFDTYRFADYKEKVIDLLARVTRVSVETVRITREMRDARR
jgi:predicted helicase